MTRKYRVDLSHSPIVYSVKANSFEEAQDVMENHLFLYETKLPKTITMTITEETKESKKFVNNYKF